MRLTIVTLLLTLLNLTSALSVPREPTLSNLSPRWPHSFTRRNDTTAETSELVLNIDPDITGAECGSIYQANINVKSAPDPFFLSTPCQSILSYLGGPKGDKDVNVVFACTGQATTGIGSRDVKIVFNPGASIPSSGATSGSQLAPSNMELVSQKDNVFITALVNIGYKMSGSKATFQFIYC